MKKCITIIGARPQFIKAAALSHQLRSDGRLQELILHTGQHYDANMSDVFFDELSIPRPRWHLEVGSGPHGQQTGRMLEAIEKVLMEERPDWVLVYGDTNSTLAGALAAAKLHLPLAHVEAGLRSFNRRMPEEINRVLTDHCSDLLLAPTATAVANLQREGVPPQRIAQVGDVMYDATLHFGQLARARSTVIDRLGLRNEGYVLATIHRAENSDDPVRLACIVDAIERVAQHWPVVLPLHPRTRARLSRGALERPGIQLIDPVGYLDMVRLEQGAAVIATDSGGVQKEAYFHAVPCVTLRDETEWVELVELGWNRLAPPGGTVDIAAAVLGAIGHQGARNARPYGAGDAASRVIDLLAGPR